MPLSTFTIGNYRSFVEPVQIELRPLTLLFGYNSAGKSALSRVLPILRDSVASRSSTPLSLASPAVRGGSFADLRSRLTGVRSLQIKLEWEDKFRFDLILQDLPDRRQHVVRDFEISKGQQVLLRGQWKLPGEGEPVSTTYKLTEGRRPSYEEDMVWEGIVPYGPLGGDGEQALIDTQDHLSELLATEWIGAIRRTPDRIRLIPDYPPDTLGSDGAGAPDLLAWDATTQGTLMGRIANWYQEHAHAPLSVKTEGRAYSLVVGRAEVNLLDTGEGLAQVLPVLVAAALAEQRAGRAFHLVLEQPELHLHPAAHAPLAAWLCDIARQDPAPRMLIETHSENFLFGVQLAVARRELAPERVRIYWVRQEQGRSTVSPIDMDEWGRLRGWPREVFTEEAELTQQILDARIKWGYR